MKREDMKAAAKFTVRCERCDRVIARKVTAFTVDRTATLHEQAHRDADRRARELGA